MSAARERFSELLDKSAQARQSTFDEDEERLAREFEQVALEIEQDMDVDDRSAEKSVPSQTSPYKPVPITKKPSKFQPRPPKKPRAVPAQPAPAEAEGHNAVVQQGEDSEDDYVYDVYIRRPLADMDMLKNPLTEHESEEQIKQAEALKSGVGVIVITPEDEDIWENFVDDDDEEWDSEDADSNGELCLRFPPMAVMACATPTQVVKRKRLLMFYRSRGQSCQRLPGRGTFLGRRRRRSHRRLQQVSPSRHVRRRGIRF